MESPRRQSGVLSHTSAWLFTAGYVGTSLGVVTLAGGPSEGAGSLWTSVGILIIYVALIAARGRQRAEILGATIGTTAVIALVTDVFNVPQPWKAAAALLMIPFVVYLTCDRRDPRAPVAT